MRREGANLAGASGSELRQITAKASTRAVACAMLSFRPMRLAPPFFSPLVRALVVLALVLASHSARAQAVTNIVGAVTRLESDGKTSADIAHPHPGGVPLNAVNFEDCAADLEFKFVLALAGTDPSYELVAYVGVDDCTPYDAREGSSPTCWSVTPGPIAQASNTTVIVRAQDLASQASVTTPFPAYPGATNSACVAQPTSAGASLWLYFFFIDANKNAIGVAQPYPIIVDTQAAVVNGAITATPEESSLTVSIPASTDTDITGWNLYCDPPRGEETELNDVAYQPPSNECVDAAGNVASNTSDASDANDDSDALASSDASASSDAGEVTDADASSDAAVAKSTVDDAGGSSCGISANDAGIPATGGCHSSTVFAASAITTTAVDGAVVTGAGKAQTVIPSVYLCGAAEPTDTTGTISGLKDGYYYDIGLAATDAVGTIGPLATVCGEPLQTSDFYDYYYSQNGRAGGGYCATDGVGLPGGTSAFGVIFAACCAAVVRRRRRG